MSKNLNKFLSLVMVMAMLLAVPAGLIKQVSANTTQEPDTFGVHLHKMLLTEAAKKAKVDFNNLKITNTGDELGSNDLQHLEAYNPEKYGKIGFTVYKLKNAEELKKSDKTPQEIAEAVAKSLGTNAPLFGAEKFKEEVFLDKNGIATFFLSTKEATGYVFVETTKPKTVAQAAKPMFLWGPVGNDAGDGYKQDIHLYPKNNVDEVTLKLKKVFKTLGKDEKTPVKDVDFNLYKLNEGADWTNAADKSTKITTKALTTNADGTITLNNLTVGKYFLVEEKSEKANVSEKAYVGRYMALSNENKLTFEYTENGEIVFPEGSLLNQTADEKEVINYERPGIEKEVNKKIGSTEKNFFNYTIKVKVPDNIKEYTKFEFLDVPNRDLELDFSSFIIADQKHKNALLESITQEEALDQAAQTAKVTAEKAGKQLSEEERKAGTVKAIRAKFDPKKLTGGETITITVKGQLKGDVKAGEIKENDAKVVYNNGYIEEEKHSQVQVKTLAHKVLKTGRGLFGTKVAQEKLQGVEFKFYKKDGDNIKWIKYEGEGKDKHLTFVNTEAEAEVFKTNAEGEILLNGLDVGEYAAKEIKTVKGYQLPVNGQEITDFNVADTDANPTTTIENIKNPDLPHTGLYWSDIIAAGLALLVIAGSAAYVVSRKKRIANAN